jgi:hypothetical protein
MRILILYSYFDPVNFPVFYKLGFWSQVASQMNATFRWEMHVLFQSVQSSLYFTSRHSSNYLVNNTSGSILTVERNGFNFKPNGSTGYHQSIKMAIRLSFMGTSYLGYPNLTTQKWLLSWYYGFCGTSYDLNCQQLFIREYECVCACFKWLMWAHFFIWSRQDSKLKTSKKVFRFLGLALFSDDLFLGINVGLEVQILTF